MEVKRNHAVSPEWRELQRIALISSWFKTPGVMFQSMATRWHMQSDRHDDDADHVDNWVLYRFIQEHD